MKVVIMVGVPGSGKTTYAKKYEEVYGNTLHLSSDKIREELYGNLIEGNTKEANQEVFKAMQHRLDEAVVNKTHKIVFYDATNTSRKRRRILYNRVKELGGEEVRVQISYLSVTLQSLKRINKGRPEEHRVPERVLLDMYKNLQVPRIKVDCDSFEVVNEPMFKESFFPLRVTEVKDIMEGANVEFAFKELRRLYTPHDCPPYHYETVDEHIDMCIENTEDRSYKLKLIAVFHDLGKSVSKEKHADGRATYRHHANISANYFLNYMAVSGVTGAAKEQAYDILEAIHQHMNAHQGMGRKNIKNNRIGPELLELINQFAAIDSESKLTEPRV